MTPIAKAVVNSTPQHYEHRVRTGAHMLVVDEPPERGGLDKGPAPFDYLLSALGGCTAITLRMYAEKKGWDLGEFQVELAYLMDGKGNTQITRSLTATGPLSEEQWQRLLEIAEKTPVTVAVRGGTQILTKRGS